MTRSLAFRAIPLLIGVIALCFSPVRAQAPKEGHETEVAGKPINYDKFLAESCAPGTKYQTLMVPMRDGVKLATDVFIPPGAGPFPVMFSRGYYGRVNSVKGGRDLKGGEFVFVAQDARGAYDSEGKNQTEVKKPDYEMNDCDDSINWIASQPWCNGKVGMVGASGNGVSPSAAYFIKNPHLVMTAPSISSAYPYYYWGFNNGTRRGLYGWLHYTGLDVSPFPAPTIPTFDMEKWKSLEANAAKDNATILTTSSGWYDISSEAVLDEFAAFAATGKVFARIGPGTHGGNPLYNWPTSPNPPGMVYAPKLPEVLLGKAKIPEKSQLVYYVMGNFRDPSTPGNFTKITDVWPVPNTPTPWYFHSGGSLSLQKPTGADAPQAYDYNPKDPAPSLGGNYTYLQPAGPQDERPLLERKDVIHFVSEPLTDPVEITGKVHATLYISTDVPDTEFVVKFTDVQPDGYEMIVRESAILGRYAEEFHGTPAPMEKGKVYQLNLDLWSTAMVLAKGHRIGVIVTSSSKDAYQVHPNTFETAMSYDASPVAHQQVYFSQQYPSCITLPVVPFDAPSPAPAADATPAPPSAPAPKQ